MANNSDYKKPFTNLYDLLPEVKQTPVNNALFSNLFNRYLTKPELIHKDGFIGVSQVDPERNLKEPTPDRQAYQLQPMLYDKIGTVEHMATYENILSELERLGVDITKNKEWNNPQKFNWIPPIDIDKLIHFRNYFWYDPDNPASRPQYITIKNLCTIAMSRVTSYDKTLATFGSSFLIIGLDPINNIIIINDNLTELFCENFVFFIGDSLNTDLDNQFWTTASSEYKSDENKTYITIKQTFTDSTINGSISLTEFRDDLLTTQDCICNGSFGWDKVLWDDNQIGEMIWNETVINAITHSTLAAWVSNPNDPTTPTGYDIWYDTSTDSLKQWTGTLPFTDEVNWKEIHRTFSMILARTEGTHFWDLSSMCTTPKNEWIDQNKWLHKSVVPNFSIAKQAQLPIIEYDPFIELNEWTFTTYDWYYRKNGLIEFTKTTEKPSLFELVEIDTYDIDNRKSFILHSKYGDLTTTFVKDYTYTIKDSFGSNYPVIGVTAGVNSSFVVTGDATKDYTTQSDIVNLQNLPYIFSVRNSPAGLLDADWTIDSIIYNSFTNETTITVIATETITTLLFTGAEIFTSNNGVYTVDYSLFENISNDYTIIGVNAGANTIDINGNLTADFNFDNAFFIKNASDNNGVWTILSMSYNAGINTTTIIVKEQLTSVFSVFGTLSISKFRTRIVVLEDINVGTGSNGTLIQDISDNSKFQPILTSQGDNWEGYGIQWAFNKANDTVPINHQTVNPYTNLNSLSIQKVDSTYGHSQYNLNDFEYSVNINAQLFSIKTLTGISSFELHPMLQKIAKKGENSVRVYSQSLTDQTLLRQYGNYDEFSEFDLTGSGDDIYVIGIAFPSLTPIKQFSNVVIEVGVASIKDFGYESVLVRTEIDDNIYDLNPSANSSTIPLIKYRKVEQRKLQLNQYPLFDMYDVVGNPANEVSSIFVFKEDQEAEINFGVNLRIVNTESEYEFSQQLLKEDNGPIFAYRSYASTFFPKYVNSFTNEINIYQDQSWDTRVLTDNFYLHTIVSELQPTESQYLLVGQLWFNTSNKTLYQYDGTNFVITNFDYTPVDLSLKTIWKPGLNKEKYEPLYVDANRTPINIGDELGAWEMPDPLYYNVHHENKVCIKLSEILTHFNTILDEQPKLPGFLGTPAQQFFMNSSPNYGLGGTIREYNDGFDTLLSSIFIDTLTPIQLINFAHDQYLSAIKSLIEFFTKDANTLLIDSSDESIKDINKVIIDQVILQYEQNDLNELLYNDSPTYNENTGLGIKNWIATAPFFGLSEKFKPNYIKDPIHKINKIFHHDGHYSQIEIQDSIRENIIRNLLLTPDIRTNAGPFYGNPSNQFTTPRPNTIGDFLTAYNATEIFPVKYWFSTLNDRILYKLNIVSGLPVMPLDSFKDGSYWYDSLTGTLRIKNGTNNWDPVTSVGDGIITAAWQEFDLNEIAAKIVLEVENRLFAALPDVVIKRFDFEKLKNDYPADVAKNELKLYNLYTKKQEIDLPNSLQGIFDLQDPFTWNYKNSNLIIAPCNTCPTGIGIGGAWQDLYYKTYGTAYPHLEPWVLQSYKDKPQWWDSQYLNTSGNRRWIYNHATTTGMWENIRIGLVPIGFQLPNGSISLGIPGEVKAYSYMSVMVDDSQVDGYNPDDLLPPFWDHKPIFGNTYTGIIRSLFNDFSMQIVQPNLDYNFNDIGTNEWIWRHSLQYIYDLQLIAFRLQPQKYMHSAIGIDYVTIDDLQLNKDTNKVYSHKDTLFHGDVLNNTELFLIQGLNQWYTNYNRFTGFDTNSSDFQSLWVDWLTPLTYQLSTFIDSRNLGITNPNYDLVENDYTLTMKHTLGIRDNWLDSLVITLLKTPPKLIKYNTEADWKFNVEIPGISGRDVLYYEIQKYPIQVDLNTNVATIYKFTLSNVNVIDNTFSIDNNWVTIFTTEFDQIESLDPIQLEIVGSFANNGTYTVSSVKYDVILNQTIIKVIETIPNSNDIGSLVSNYKTFSWNTGDEVRLTSDKIMPRPFAENESYFLIKESSSSFKLARNRNNAFLGNAIPFNTLGTGQLFIGQIDSTFQAISGRNSRDFWKKYTIDKTKIKKFNTQFQINGVQHLIDFIYGYEEYTKDDYWRYNFDKLDVDQELGRVVNWQFEIEKFIDKLFTIQIDKFNAVDIFGAIADPITDILEFTPFIPGWKTGTKVILSSENDIPEPLIKNVPYFLIRDPNNKKNFQLSLTIDGSKTGNNIDLLTTGNDIFITKFKEKKSFPTFELNPFKFGIWHETPQGILSNVLNGPFLDIRSEQTVYDQYGRLVNSNDLNVIRQDKISKICLIDRGINDVELTNTTDSIHFGGFHIFVDGYEHVIFFENYSSDGFLIYDPYIGLNTGRFDLIFEGQPEFILRPNVGGQFLSNNTQLLDNMETNIVNLQHAYDTYSTAETDNMTTLARKGLGYTGQKEYLDHLNINSKSQFIFWKGLIQSKGTVSAVKAFINSRKFLDAKIDEFWAFKLSEFGDIKRKIYPEINVEISDSLSNEFKIDFIKKGQTPELNFKPILIDDKAIWVKYPDQKNSLNSLGEQFYFNAELTNVDDIDSKRIAKNGDYIQSQYNPFEQIGAEWFYETITLQDHIIITYEERVLEEPTWDNDNNIVTPEVLINSNYIIKTKRLIEGTDFERINSKLIKFYNDPEQYTNSISNNTTKLKIYTLNFAKSKHNTSKIIDFQSKVVITNIPVWDPAKNHHYHITNHLIDFTENNDVALYNNSLITSQNVAIKETNPKQGFPWDNTQKDLIWLDNSCLGYYPYYDELAEPSITNRIKNWGKLADWAKICLYQWTESNVPPAQWDDLAIIEEVDKTIDSQVRVTGRTKKNIYIKTSIDPAPLTYDRVYERNDNFFVAKQTNNIYTLSFIEAHISLTDQASINLGKDNINIKVYLNGKYIGDILPADLNKSTKTVDITQLLTDTGIVLNNQDELIFIQPEYSKFDVDGTTRLLPTNVELDDGTYVVDTPYTEIITKDQDLVDKSTYYFWVEDKSLIIKDLLSMTEIKEQMVNIPIPYMIVQDFSPKEEKIYPEVTLPDRYTKLIIRGLSGIINENNRYKLRFTHDFTLRDNLDDGRTPLDLKNTHDEWKLFRAKQLFHVDRGLWDKITESIIGETIISGTRVPSLEKELYDAEFDKVTRYGLEKNQIFIESDLAKAIIMDDLFDPAIDFYPVDINSFIANNNFDTTANAKTMMDNIYNRFASEHVNRIYFKILHAALTYKVEYPNIFKTSYIALHGIRVLNTIKN